MRHVPIYPAELTLSPLAREGAGRREQAEGKEQRLAKKQDSVDIRR